jgi:hypothetical protein
MVGLLLQNQAEVRIAKKSFLIMSSYSELLAHTTTIFRFFVRKRGLNAKEGTCLTVELLEN